MPALPPYLPAKEADFTNWLANFSTLISASPSAYGLLPSDEATIATPTKSPFMLDLPPADVGMSFYAAARWATQTDLVGPWSPIINFFVTN